MQFAYPNFESMNASREKGLGKNFLKLCQRLLRVTVTSQQKGKHFSDMQMIFRCPSVSGLMSLNQQQIIQRGTLSMQLPNATYTPTFLLLIKIFNIYFRFIFPLFYKRPSFHVCFLVSAFLRFFSPTCSVILVKVYEGFSAVFKPNYQFSFSIVYRDFFLLFIFTERLSSCSLIRHSKKCIVDSERHIANSLSCSRRNFVISPNIDENL